MKWAKRDRYRRIVGFVIVDGHDVNLAQVKAGTAWFYRYYQRELSPEDRRLYADAENKARNERLGLWRENNPTRPGRGGGWIPFSEACRNIRRLT